MRIALTGLQALAVAATAVAQPDFRWVQTYEGGGLYIDEVAVTLSDPAGDLYLAGTSHDGIDGLDMLICKMSRETGALLWETRVPAFDTNDMATSGMVWDGLGDLLVAGYVVGCVG